jgi:hypothetical protein
MTVHRPGWAWNEAQGGRKSFFLRKKGFSLPLADDAIMADEPTSKSGKGLPQPS